MRRRRGDVADRAPQPGDGEPTSPDGKIHHWAGAVFVPGITVDGRAASSSPSSPARSPQHYEDVIASRLIARDGDAPDVPEAAAAKVVTVDLQHRARGRVPAVRRDARRGRSVATRIAKLADAGTPQEREKPAGSDSGYLWRLNAYWRYEAVNGGVLIECESVSLSRAVPVLLRPFITGMVEGVARESLRADADQPAPHSRLEAKVS